MKLRKWFGINWCDIQNTTQEERYKNLLNSGMLNIRTKGKTMLIKIQTRIIQESVGGVISQNIQDYIDPKDAVLGLAHQLGFIIKKSDVKPKNKKEAK